MYIEGETLDDLLRASLYAVMARGHRIAPTKGNARELIGVTLRLANPLARFSRNESRGVLFSALGETLWYLSGSDDFDVIEYYIPRYRERCETPSEVSRSEAAYGPRLKAQLPFILRMLGKKDTRPGVRVPASAENTGSAANVESAASMAAGTAGIKRNARSSTSSTRRGRRPTSS
jgi:thymidylate synthase